MTDKNDKVINVRLPGDMKEQLKLKLGTNMSKIMKEHFQKLLDVKDYENRNSCFQCRKNKKYDECSFAGLKQEDNSQELFIFCNDCLKKGAPDCFEGEEITVFECIKDIARENNHPEHLAELSKMCNDRKDVVISSYEHDDYNLCEVSPGKLFFSSEFDRQMQEYQNGNSTQTHNPEPSNLTYKGTQSPKNQGDWEAEKDEE